MDSAENKSWRLASVKLMSSLSPYSTLFSESALRGLIDKAQPRLSSKGHQLSGNGLLEAGAILRVGRRIFFDLDRFDDWLKSHRTKPTAK